MNLFNLNRGNNNNCNHPQSPPSSMTNNNFAPFSAPRANIETPDEFM